MKKGSLILTKMSEQLTLFDEKIFFNLHADYDEAQRTLHELQKIGIVIGTDEAGRGALAGPVVAAAVFLTHEQEQALLKMNLRDSKLISPNRREKLFEAMKELKVLWRACRGTPEMIDKENILQASLMTMGKSIQNLAKNLPDEKNIFVIVDGNSKINNINFQQWNLIRADKLIPVVSAASIVAKVIRDKIMTNYHSKYPEYNFAQNKGYPTKFHIEAVKKFGLSDIHRKTFCRKLIQGGENFNAVN